MPTYHDIPVWVDGDIREVTVSQGKRLTETHPKNFSIVPAGTQVTKPRAPGETDKILQKVQEDQLKDVRTKGSEATNLEGKKPKPEEAKAPKTMSPVESDQAKKDAENQTGDGDGKKDGDDK